jgi:hypothetical protein
MPEHGVQVIVLDSWMSFSDVEALAEPYHPAEVLRITGLEGRIKPWTEVNFMSGNVDVVKDRANAFVEKLEMVLNTAKIQVEAS